MSSKTIDIYAHRGSTLLAPENTLPAFELATSYHADVLEVDVRLSRDMQVIVTHDARVDRTSNGQGLVKNYTLTDLKKLDAAWHFEDREKRSFRHQGVQFLTLNELFDCFPIHRINIDIKDNSHQAAEAVSRCIYLCNVEKRVNVGSFHRKVIKHFRQITPGVTTAATQSEVASLYFARNLIKNVPYQYLQIPTSHYGIPLASKQFISFARQLDLASVYWTINTAQMMQSLIDKGVNGIVTDRVDLAAELLKRRSFQKKD